MFIEAIRLANLWSKKIHFLADIFSRFHLIILLHHLELSNQCCSNQLGQRPLYVPLTISVDHQSPNILVPRKIDDFFQSNIIVGILRLFDRFGDGKKEKGTGDGVGKERTLFCIGPAFQMESFIFYLTLRLMSDPVNISST